MKYSIGDKVIDEDGNEGVVGIRYGIRYNDGDFVFWPGGNDAAHPNPKVVEPEKPWPGLDDILEMRGRKQGSGYHIPEWMRPLDSKESKHWTPKEAAARIKKTGETIILDKPSTPTRKDWEEFVARRPHWNQFRNSVAWEEAIDAWWLTIPCAKKPSDYDSTLLVAATAHRAYCGSEHDPTNGKLHGYCVVCGVPWPCETASRFIAIHLKKELDPTAETHDQWENRKPVFWNTHDLDGWVEATKQWFREEPER